MDIKKKFLAPEIVVLSEMDPVKPTIASEERDDGEFDIVTDGQG